MAFDYHIAAAGLKRFGERFCGLFMDRPVAGAMANPPIGNRSLDPDRMPAPIRLATRIVTDAVERAQLLDHGPVCAFEILQPARGKDRAAATFRGIAQLRARQRVEAAIYFAPLIGS